MDYKYKFVWCPMEDEYQAARLAVLYPLCGLQEVPEGEKAKETYLAAGTALLEQWRARLYALRAAGLERLQKPSNLQYARNCWPGGMLALTANPGDPIERGKPCHLKEVCPWCWSRRTVEVYQRVRAGSQAAMSIDGRKANHFRLVSFSRGWLHGFDTLDADQGPLLLRQAHEDLRRTLRYFAKGNEVGSFLSTVAHPASTGGNLVGWQAASRGLLLLPGCADLVKLDEAWNVFDGTPSKKEGESGRILPDWPVGSNFRTHVARLCRYPAPLMRADPVRTVQILRARAGLRLAECYGCFRAVSLEEAAVPAQEGREPEERRPE